MPIYSEKCSSVLASTFSSGNMFQAGIITSDLNNKCTRHHTGTSASAPIGAGIIALTLEANSKLTWRDVQYLIIATANPNKLRADDWQRNGVGRYFSHNYGYGLMNGGKMTELSLKWPLIGQHLNFTIAHKKFFRAGLVERKKSRIFLLNVNKSEIGDLKHLEHVLAVISLESGIRGQLRINLLSPSGTKSNLLEFRKKDRSLKGFTKWPFMSVHFWSENPVGTWYLEVINNSTQEVHLIDWQLQLFGVSFVPDLFFQKN